MSIMFKNSKKPMYSLKKRKDTDENESLMMSADPFKQIKSLMGAETTDKDKNHIYFYGDVDSDSCLDLNRQINDLNKELLKYSIEYDAPPPNIFLHINSNGGCLLSAMSTVDTIRNSRVPIVSIVEGSAASAATIISMVCHRRYITPNSFMLIHQLSTGIYGKYEEIKDDFMNDTKFMERLYSLYRSYTKMSDKKIKSILTRDIWWDSDECVKYGLVDDKWNPNMTALKVLNVLNNHSFESEEVTKTMPSYRNGEDEDESDEDDTKDVKKSKKRRVSRKK